MRKVGKGPGREPTSQWGFLVPRPCATQPKPSRPPNQQLVLLVCFFFFCLISSPSISPHPAFLRLSLSPLLLAGPSSRRQRIPEHGEVVLLLPLLRPEGFDPAPALSHRGITFE